jgi:hypothetical protein
MGWGREGTILSQRSSADAGLQLFRGEADDWAERVAEFMRETNPELNAGPGRGDDRAVDDYSNRSTRAESKRKGGWWSAIFGGDKD